MSQPTSLPPLRSEFVSDSDMIELVQEFVQELPNRVELIESMLAKASYSDLRRLAHQIKGAAGGYGFSPISESAAKLESLLKAEFVESDLQKLRAQVDELVGLCRRATAS